MSLLCARVYWQIHARSVLLLSPFSPGDVFLTFWLRFLLAPLVLDACVSSVGSLVGCVDEITLLVGGLLGEQGLPFLPPSLENGAHRGDLLPRDRDTDFGGVDAHGSEDSVAAQSVTGFPCEICGDPAATACTRTRLPDSGEAIVILESPKSHSGLTGVADYCDNIGIERAVAEGGYGEVLDIRGDDVIVVDEASATRGGRAEDAEAGR